MTGDRSLTCDQLLGSTASLDPHLQRGQHVIVPIDFNLTIRTASR
jgi:hypothetical protein